MAPLDRLLSVMISHRADQLLLREDEATVAPVEAQTPVTFRCEGSDEVFSVRAMLAFPNQTFGHHTVSHSGNPMRRIAAVLAGVWCAVLFFALPVVAQQAPASATPIAVSLPNTVQRVLVSKVTHVTYRLDIALPAGFDTTTRKYPVFLMLDGNLAFASTLGIYTGLGLGNGVPPMILVGVGYPGNDPRVFTPDYVASRTRDYTPTQEKTTGVVGLAPKSGEARAFLTFIRDELIPFLEAEYRTDPADRGLGGHSLGGLFTTYALLNEPALFTRYWVGSPSLWWDNGVSFSWIAPAKAAAVKPHGRAYITVGSEESDVMVVPMKKLDVSLRANFSNLSVGAQVFPEETHVSVIGAAISRAFRFLYGNYGRPSILLGPKDTAGYVGAWKSADGQQVSLVAKGKGMELQQSLVGKKVSMALLAADRDHLFSRAWDGTVTAERDGAGKVVRLRSDIGGPPTVFERVRK